MDGYELATRLKKMRLLPADLRLIAFSGHHRSPERERSSHLVFDHYLMKPGSLDVLVDAVDHAGASS
jgi:DNA-binding NarL/FixJ family response regulator